MLGLTEMVNDGFRNRKYAVAVITTTTTTIAAITRFFLMVSPRDILRMYYKAVFKPIFIEFRYL